MRRAERVLRATSVAVGLALLPALGHAQSIQTDYDRSFDFSRLKTYAYVDVARDPRDPLAVNPMNERRVRAALDSQLLAHGYTPDSSGKADFLVAYHAATRQRVSVQELGYGIGRLGPRRLDVDQYTEGTLVVDVVDAATRQLVWRGSATGTIAPKEADAKIRKAVAKLMGQFRKDTTRRA
jgi:uncharacterized protein DUF4136